jgi:hypothetical protein
MIKDPDLLHIPFVVPHEDRLFLAPLVVCRAQGRETFVVVVEDVEDLDALGLNGSVERGEEFLRSSAL